MAYEKQTWTNGEIITADKLNHIEDGVSMGEKIIIAEIQPISYTEGTCNLTFDEIKNYIQSGYVVLFSMTGWISTNACTYGAITDGERIVGSGIAINGLNNAISVVKAEYIYNHNTGQKNVTLTITDYVQAPTTG